MRLQQKRIDILMKKKAPHPNDYSAYIGHNQFKDLPEIIQLAEAQHEAQKKVDRLESDLKTAKEELRHISEKRLPEVMDNLGLTTYSTKSGISVEVVEKIRASLPVENRSKAYAWLEDNNFGGMIKSSVIVSFKRDQLEEANKLVKELVSAHRPASLERKVEAPTLTAFVKEQLSQGKDIPLDIFGVFRQRESVVEIKK